MSFTGHARKRVTSRKVRIAERVARTAITIGGIGTIVAVATICVFLVWVVFPLFRSGSLERFFVGLPACPYGLGLVIFQVAPKARWSLKTQQFRGHRTSALEPWSGDHVGFVRRPR